MKIKLYRILAISLAIFFTIFSFGRQVKAVAGGAVASGAASLAASAAITYMLVQMIVDCCQMTIEALSSYEDETGIETALSEEDRKRLSELAEAEITTYMNQRQQEVYAEGYYDLHFLDMSDTERITYFTQAQLYFQSKNGKLSPAQQIVYSVLQSFENQSSKMKLDELDRSLSISGNVFAELYGDALQNSLPDILGADATVANNTGLSLRQIAMSYPDGLPEHFPSLCAKYGAVNCFKNELLLTDSPSDIDGYVSFFILTDGEKIAFSQNIGYTYIYNKYGQKFCKYNFEIDVDSSSYSSSYYCEFGDDLNNLTTIKNSDRAMRYLSITGSYANSDYFSDDTSLNLYVFLFDTKEKAQFMHDDFVNSLVSADTSEENVYYPDVILGDVLSDLEQAIERQKSSLGVDDVDVVVNPGAVKADDGSIAYNPSISVGGTKFEDLDLSQSMDIDFSEAIEDFKTPSSITTKFPFSIPFDIYHLFNVFSASPASPHWDISFDFTSIGAGDYSFTIDLSDYDWIANIVRWLVYAVFLVGLAILTNKVIGRG